jgi:hypothetical protein
MDGNAVAPSVDSDNHLCLALVGHPELRRRLNMAVHEALSQRIVPPMAGPRDFCTRSRVPVLKGFPQPHSEQLEA